MAGNISQWGEVKKKQPKPKETTSHTDSSVRGRGRGGLEGRGRGRGAERGAARGGRGARTVSQANGTKTTEKQAATSDGWGEPAAATNGDATEKAQDWANEPGKDGLESLETVQAKPASAAAPATVKSGGGWASLFAKPPPPPAAKEDIPPPPTAQEQADQAIPTAEPEETIPIAAPEQPAGDDFAAPPIEPLVVDDGPSELPSAPHSEVGANETAPPGDELTKENVNRLPDASVPMSSLTVASTAASTQDPVHPALPTVHAVRPGMSGHAASALRATTGAGRSASHTRKILEQQEAVVMPGHQAVDRAAVQFGKVGLDSEDGDEEREDPETRTQLPDDSPAAPRASLPPAPAHTEPQQPAQPIAAEPPVEAQAQRTPSGLPSAPQAMQEPSPPQGNSYPDQYRYAQGQKPYDPFSQQPQHPQPPSEPFSSQLPGQSQAPPSSQQEAYQQYYGREYGSYYGYGQQGQDQQRSGSAFGTSAAEAPGHYASAGPRGYGSQDLASGGNTPNPTTAAHQSQPSGHMQQGPHQYAGYPYGQYGGSYGSAYPQYSQQYGSMAHHQGGHGGRYGASRPAFDDVRRQQEDQYANQYGYGHNQGYSGSYGKSSMYGGPQQQYSQHDYSSSPGNAAFAGRENYGRAGSTQPGDNAQSNTGSNAFGGGMQDPFGRTPSGFGQSQHGAHNSEDPAKPTGPSPSLQSGRPGSAAQGMTGQQQSGLPHQHSGQQAFAGYPQYGGFGNQNNQHSSYANYGSNAFAGYGAAYGRGGWANQYGSGQH